MKLFLAFTIFFMALSISAKIKNESEVSLIKTGGNSSVETYGVKSKSIYTFGIHDIEFSGEYNFAQSDSVTSKENWTLALKYDHSFTKTLGIYLGQEAEGDRFKGISRRYNSDIGLSYVVIKSDRRNLKTEFGYRFTKEETVAGSDENFSKSRIYLAYDEVINKNMKFKYWLEFLPNFSESDDYLVSMEPALEVVLAKQLFLKLSYEWKYANLPELGKAKADYSFKTSLLATF